MPELKSGSLCPGILLSPPGVFLPRCAPCHSALPVSGRLRYYLFLEVATLSVVSVQSFLTKGHSEQEEGFECILIDLYPHIVASGLRIWSLFLFLLIGN